MESSFNYFQVLGQIDSSTRVALILTPKEITQDGSIKYLTDNKEFLNDLNSSSFQCVYHSELKIKFLLAQLKTNEDEEKNRIT